MVRVGFGMCRGKQKSEREEQRLLKAWNEKWEREVAPFIALHEKVYIATWEIVVHFVLSVTGVWMSA